MLETVTDNTNVPCLSIQDIKDTLPLHAGHVSVSWLMKKLEAKVKKKLHEKNRNAVLQHPTE